MTSIDTNQRFEFGDNWSQFLKLLDEARIESAERAIVEMLGTDELSGLSFLDMGSGSGLSSLVARRLGAQVHSFDYDRQSVACTEELKRRYFSGDTDWRVEQGSALDNRYVSGLGEFDIVYSWGVLHHTGAMWLGIENAVRATRNGGILFLALYNDQGFKSHVWWFIKFLYNKLPRPMKKAYAYTLGILAYLINILKYSLKLQPMKAIRPLLNYRKNRGMNLTHDIIDWIGGYPYEVVGYDLLVEYMHVRDFELVKGKKATSLGCHEMVFRKTVQE